MHARMWELRGDPDRALALIRQACREHRSDLVVQNAAARMFDRLGHAEEGQTARDLAQALEMGAGLEAARP